MSSYLSKGHGAPNGAPSFLTFPGYKHLAPPEQSTTAPEANSRLLLAAHPSFDNALHLEGVWHSQDRCWS